MGFRGTLAVGLLVVVVLWTLRGQAMVGAGDDEGGSTITVVVNDSAHISLSTLSQSELEASRIFRNAGINIVWVDCRGETVVVEDACHRVPGTDDFVLHIVSNGKTSSDILGIAFLGEDGGGRYSDVFFNRVEQAYGELGESASQLLGAVAAHELGHLLLGSYAHSYIGIMNPHWKAETLRQMDRGSLLFTREQAELMRARLRRGEIRLASTERLKVE